MSQSIKSRILSAYLLRIGISIMVLILAGYLYTKLDLSRGKNNSLGAYSRQTVGELKDKMVVKVYASRDLPAQFNTLNRYLKDLLTEFRNSGKGRFSFEYARYKDAADLKDQAELVGLQAIPVQDYQNDQVVMKNVYLGIVFEYQGKSDRLNIFPGVEPTLEYELVKMIQNLSGKLLPKITVFQDSTYKYYPTQLITRELNANYKLTITDLASMPEYNSVMLFTGIKDSLSTAQLYNLDQYIMKGGKVIFLQDRINSDQMGVRSFDANLFELLEHYGVRIQPNMVLDRDCMKGQGQGLGTVADYLFFPVVKGMNKNPITKNTDNTILYFASEITPLDSLKIKFEPILQSSADSGRLRGPVFNIEALLNTSDGQYPLGNPPITVGARIQGRLTSYFADKPALQHPNFIASQDKAEFIIYGDRELFMDPDDPQYFTRLYVVLNAIDWFTGNPSLIRIRTRQMTSSHLNLYYYMYLKHIDLADPTPMYRRLSMLFKTVAIVVPPLLMMILGLAVWSANQRREVYKS